MSWLLDKISGLILKVSYNFGWTGYDASKDKARDHPVVPEGSLDRSQKAKLENQGCDVDGREETKQNGN